MVIDAPSQYDVIMGQPAISAFEAIILIAHLQMKYLVEDRKGRIIGVGIVQGNQQLSRHCYDQSVRNSETFKRAGSFRSAEDDELELKRRRE